MSRIEIRHIGAIKNISIDINKVNIIMGPQSSGKSTIAKVISFCQWAEKRFMLDGEVFLYDVENQLFDYHHLAEYIKSNSEFIYVSDVLTISYKNKSEEFSIKLKDKGLLAFKNTKNSYIPAERNFASAIPNLDEFYKSEDNLKNFLRDWYKIKRGYSSKNLTALKLGIAYQYEKKTDTDYVVLSNGEGEEKKLILNEASSGVQSIIPLLSLINNATDSGIGDEGGLSIRTEEYLNDQLDSFFPLYKDLKTTANLSIALQYEEKETSLIDEGKKAAAKVDDLRPQIKAFVNNFKSYQFSRLIIEEPEQNLFPSTQRDLVYYLLSRVLSADKEHQVFITTHSPYILYALNNCMMGYSIKDKMPEAEQQEFNERSRLAWINPDLVSVWEIVDGELRDVKDVGTKTIDEHYLEQAMGELMDEFYQMLNYFE